MKKVGLTGILIVLDFVSSDTDNYMLTTTSVFQGL